MDRGSLPDRCKHYHVKMIQTRIQLFKVKFGSPLLLRCLIHSKQENLRPYITTSQTLKEKYVSSNLFWRIAKKEHLTQLRWGQQNPDARTWGEREIKHPALAFSRHPHYQTPVAHWSPRLYLCPLLCLAVKAKETGAGVGWGGWWCPGHVCVLISTGSGTIVVLKKPGWILRQKFTWDITIYKSYQQCHHLGLISSARTLGRHGHRSNHYRDSI